MAQPPNRGVTQLPPATQAPGPKLPPAQSEVQQSARPIAAATNPNQTVLGVGELSSISVSQLPRPLDGTEVAALAVWLVAAELAKALQGNGRLGQLASFRNYIVKYQVALQITSKEDSMDTISVAPGAIELDLSAINLDYYRALAGMGLWHEGRLAVSNQTVEFRMMPSEAVLKHLASLGPELVKPLDDGIHAMANLMIGIGR